MSAIVSASPTMYARPARCLSTMPKALSMRLFRKAAMVGSGAFAANDFMKRQVAK